MIEEVTKERCPNTLDMFEGKRVKVAELVGDLLDYYVAIAAGARVDATPMENLAASGFMLQWRSWRGQPFGGLFAIVNQASLASAWKPSTDWSIAGQIIEREKIATTWAPFAGHWYGMKIGDSIFGLRHAKTGATPPVAAMRVYVASKFGDEVPDV